MPKTEIINFTKENITKVPLTKKGRKLYRDSKERYLFLFVTSKSKAFYFYRKFQGKPIQIHIKCQTIPQARAKIAEYNASIAKGISPIQEKKQNQEAIQNAQTLKKVFSIYISKRKDNKNKREDISKFNKYFSKLHEKKLEDIRTIDIELALSVITEKPYLFNRTYELIRAVFYFGIKKLEIETDNPCTRINKKKEHARQRILNKDELNNYYNVCHSWSTRPDKAMHSDIFLMLLYTGQRLDNVLSMEFQEIDLVAETWTIPPKKTKTEEYYNVFLIPAALEIIKHRYSILVNEYEYVFPSPRIPNTYIKEIKWQWRKFLEEAGITNFTRHDVRRTAGSLILMKTGNLKLVQKFMNHKSIETTARVYAHIWESELSDKISGAFQATLPS